MGNAVQLPADGAQQHDHPGALDAAAGGAGTGATEHEDHQNHLGEVGPEHKVRRGKAGGGNDGRHLEEGVAQAVPHVLIDGHDIDGDQRGRARHQQQEEPGLIALERLLEPALKQKEVQAEVQGEEQGEDGDDDLSGGITVGAHTEIAVGEAAGAGGGKGVNEGIIQRQTADLQQNDLRQREGEVHLIEDLGGLRLLGHQLGKDRTVFLI